MKIDKEINKQKEIIKELNVIIDSWDYFIANYEYQQGIHNQKTEALKKLKFLYAVKKGDQYEEK